MLLGEISGLLWEYGLKAQRDCQRKQGQAKHHPDDYKGQKGAGPAMGHVGRLSRSRRRSLRAYRQNGVRAVRHSSARG
jgi:hypothetical protein